MNFFFFFFYSFASYTVHRYTIFRRFFRSNQHWYRYISFCTSSSSYSHVFSYRGRVMLVHDCGTGSSSLCTSRTICVQNSYFNYYLRIYVTLPMKTITRRRILSLCNFISIVILYMIQCIHIQCRWGWSWIVASRSVCVCVRAFVGVNGGFPVRAYAYVDYVVSASVYQTRSVR